MPMNDISQFTQDVYNIVAQIPRGKVATYGQIAWLAGWPKHSRLVGRVMKGTPASLHLPCHRVVNHQGRLAPDFKAQRGRLISESVAFRKNGNVDLATSQWQYMEDGLADARVERVL
jgi:methylated-DNA-protein-cysteine methyltransferase related protein